MVSKQQKDELAKATVQGMLWSYASKYSGKIMVFISTLILARLLIQEDFGVAGYALTIISFIEVMQGLGIRPALIYYDLDNERTNTAFWLGVGVGVVLGVVTWLIAPWVGEFFHDPRAIDVTRVLGLSFPIRGFSLVHDALLRKEMQFNRQFVPEVLRSIGKGLISIVLAFWGYGYWSLIMGQVAGTLVGSVALWRVISWRPSFSFSRAHVPALLSYGSHLVAVDIIALLRFNLDYLLIGRYLGAAALGVYTLAFRVPDLLINQFCTLLAQVVFPAFSKIQKDLTVLRESALQAMRYVAIITVPMGIGLIMIAEPFTLLAFGWEWEEAISVVPWIAVYAVLRSLVFNFGNVYKAQGNPALLTRVSFLHLVVLVPLLWWGVWVEGSVTAVGMAQAAGALFNLLLHFYVARQVLKTTCGAIWVSLKPAVLAGGSMALVLWILMPLVGDWSHLLQVVTAVVVGVIWYAGTLYFLQKDVVLEATRTLRGAVKRGK